MTTAAPKPDAPSALLVTSSVPLDAASGYPYALQVYKTKGQWDWVLTGIADNPFNRTKDETFAALREEFGPKTAKQMVGWYRWVKVLWWQVAPKDGKGGRKWIAEEIEATEGLIPLGIKRTAVKLTAAKPSTAKKATKKKAVKRR